MRNVFVLVEQIDEIQKIDVGHAGDQVDSSFFKACEYLPRSFWTADVTSNAPCFPIPCRLVDYPDA